MLSLYEILKASKTGIAPDMWTALAGKNWGGADSGHEIKELTGIPPLTFRADGTPLLDYLISGNMSRTGTPTPTNPIQPSECGDLETTGVHAGQYKIPISSGGVTTNIYLGSTQTTRQIKKIVLTGDEYWDTGIVGANRFFYTYITDAASVYMPIQSSHYIPSNVHGTQRPNNSIRQTAFAAAADINIRDDACATLSDFKQYLAAQYAAGTPVTVWYVLANPETAAVNEPLRKIGDYADTVSMEQAGVSIPTLNGQTVIDVETTLKPSEMYIKYNG